MRARARVCRVFRVCHVRTTDTSFAFRHTFTFTQSRQKRAELTRPKDANERAASGGVDVTASKIVHRRTVPCLIRA